LLRIGVSHRRLDFADLDQRGMSSEAPTVSSQIFAES